MAFRIVKAITIAFITVFFIGLGNSFFSESYRMDDDISIDQ